eukprot:CAMPEP_0196144998 /NCGR_PEP_ID=MMETSP0910-20130528/18682_1 /TAXON_ID=49265 /ORGANISM="Thalassiosira rotula, Strain GSO102" /LENGTH=46 /DNA_ID= /DNA_START= /DNA_END= /DNA_ORIENTATION=
MASIIHSQANIAREYILSYTMDTGKVMIDQDLGCAPNGSDAICDTP